jgi:hypothetical protein
MQGGKEINDFIFRKILKLETSYAYNKANRKLFEVLAIKTIS